MSNLAISIEESLGAGLTPLETKKAVSLDLGVDIPLSMIQEFIRNLKNDYIKSNRSNSSW